MRLRYTGRAKDDLDIAFEWYEDREWQKLLDKESFFADDFRQGFL